MAEPEVTKIQPSPPTVLTENEVAEVAGGTINALVVAGCPACTSGGRLSLRDAFAAVVNPAQTVE